MRLGWWSIRIFLGGFLLAIVVAPRRYDEMGNALQHIGVEMIASFLPDPRKMDRVERERAEGPRVTLAGRPSVIGK
jgi:hypothetical protein